MIRFRPAGPNGRVPLAGGGVSTTWWGGFEHAVFDEPQPAAPYPEEVAYSSSITRPACSCKILGQGCAVPQEGAPTGGVVSKPGEGPSTAVVAGGVGALALLGLLATGVI